MNSKEVKIMTSKELDKYDNFMYLTNRVIKPFPNTFQVLRFQYFFFNFL